MSTLDFTKLVAEAGPPEPEDATDTRVLEATLRLIGEYGERRLTMDDIAAASRVGRATLFRRYGSKDALVTRLYAREVRRALAALHEAVSGADDPLEAGFAALTDHVCSHPVTVQLARAEPERMTDLWRSGDPSGFSLIRGFLEGLSGPGRTERCDELARLVFSHLMLPPAP